MYIGLNQYDKIPTTNNRRNNMKVDQHLKIAQWHVEQARLHATVEGGYSCGCPLTDEYQKVIDQVESGNIVDDDK